MRKVVATIALLFALVLTASDPVVFTTAEAVRQFCLDHFEKRQQLASPHDHAA